MAPRLSLFQPRFRRRRPTILALRALAVAIAASGCEEDESAAVDVGPIGDPSLAFVEPSGESPGPICVEVSDDADARVPLLVEVAEVVLRAPGACGSYVQCGHLSLFVNEELNNESAVPGIDLLLRKLADRYHDGAPLPDSGEPDVLTVRVEVQNDLGVTMSDHAGQPLEDAIELITLADCPAPGD